MWPTLEKRFAQLEKLLVCPVCHSELDISGLRRNGVSECDTCRYRFSFENGVYDFTPVPPPDEDVARIWNTWEELQKNGSIFYELDPEHNLSIGERDDARAFATFSHLSGVTLDIGCGPQRQQPSYATVSVDNYVGIDPLRGIQPRDFVFVQGIAEYLPFRSSSFNHIVFATSLDHLLSTKRALAESRRVLKPYGSITIWFADVTRRPSSLSILRARIRFAFSLLNQGKFRELWQRSRRKLGIDRSHAHAKTNVPLTTYSTEMTIPTGAADYFHVAHPSQTEVMQWLDEVGLSVVKTKIYHTNNVFMKVIAKR